MSFFWGCEKPDDPIEFPQYWYKLHGSNEWKGPVWIGYREEPDYGRVIKLYWTGIQEQTLTKILVAAYDSIYIGKSVNFTIEDYLEGEPNRNPSKLPLIYCSSGDFLPAQLDNDGVACVTLYVSIADMDTSDAFRGGDDFRVKAECMDTFFMSPVMRIWKYVEVEYDYAVEDLGGGDEFEYDIFGWGSPADELIRKAFGEAYNRLHFIRDEEIDEWFISEPSKKELKRLFKKYKSDNSKEMYLLSIGSFKSNWVDGKIDSVIKERIEFGATYTSNITLGGVDTLISVVAWWDIHENIVQYLEFRDHDILRFISKVTIHELGHQRGFLDDEPLSYSKDRCVMVQGRIVKDTVVEGDTVQIIDWDGTWWWEFCNTCRNKLRNVKW